MRTGLLVYILIAGFFTLLLALSFKAFAAVPPSLKPELSSKKTQPVCVDTTTTQRFVIDKDGKMRPSGGSVTIIKACE